MPILFQNLIQPADLRLNLDAIYVFGDNERRLGRGGQARVMRDHSNSIGVRTKKAPSMDPKCMWTDVEFERNADFIDEDLEEVENHLKRGRVVVLPSSGLGTGMSKLPEEAPRTYNYLSERLARLVRIYNKKEMS